MENNKKIVAYYLDKKGWLHELTSKSIITAYKNEDKYAVDKFGHKLAIATSLTYRIDGHEVSEGVFDDACQILTKYKKNSIEERIKNMYNLYYERDTIDKLNDIIDKTAPKLGAFRYPWGVKTSEIIKNKENDTMKKNEWIPGMPSIKSHKYIKDHGVTIIEWSDGSVTKTVCDPTIADEFTGFCSAIAKRAMGNGGKMLSEWERLVIKPEKDKKKAEEKARIEAEQKAEEEKRRAEAKARRDEKKARRNAKREELERQKAIEEIAEIFAKDYAETSLYDEAAKLAMEKYGVPKEFFNNRCDCDCKEFDVIDSDDDSISD